jgi:hypothetical protein
MHLNKRQKCFIGFITNRYCDSRGLTNDTIDLRTEIALRYEPLCRTIFNTNSLFLGAKRSVSLNLLKISWPERTTFGSQKWAESLMG